MPKLLQIHSLPEPNPKANRSSLVSTMGEAAGDTSLAGQFPQSSNLDEYPVACHFTQGTCIAGFHAQAV